MQSCLCSVFFRASTHPHREPKIPPAQLSSVMRTRYNSGSSRSCIIIRPVQCIHYRSHRHHRRHLVTASRPSCERCHVTIPNSPSIYSSCSLVMGIDRPRLVSTRWDAPSAATSRRDRRRSRRRWQHRLSTGSTSTWERVRWLCLISQSGRLGPRWVADVVAVTYVTDSANCVCHPGWVNSSWWNGLYTRSWLCNCMNSHVRRVLSNIITYRFDETSGTFPGNIGSETFQTLQIVSVKEQCLVSKLTPETYCS